MNRLRLTRLISRLSYLTKSKPVMILIKSKYSTQIDETLVDNGRKLAFLNRVKKFKHLGTMQPVIEKFGVLWLNSFEQKLDNNQKCVVITNKVRISEDNAAELEEFLWEEFFNSKDNIYHVHLGLIEYFNTNSTIYPDACIIFLNRTFESWWKQQLNRIKRSVSKNTCHLLNNCTDASCLCSIQPHLVQKAFNLAMLKIFLLTSMNKIYKFEDNFQILKPHIDIFLSSSSQFNCIKLVNELKLNDLYRIDYESAIIPLLIEDKYSAIEEMIASNEKTLYAFVDVCNKLCDGTTNFKKIADSYNMKKTHNFSGSKIAKYAVNCLRRLKKTQLLATMYPGIIFQLKLNQLRFLINSRYSQSDPISFDGWSELVVNLVADNENLIHQLFLEVVSYNKDVLLGIYFSKRYGDGYIEKLPSSAQALYNNNLNLILPDYDTKIIQLKETNRDKYYWPDDLSNDDLIFVGTKDEFKYMLDYFETEKPDIIGLDCEWKPSFGTEDLVDDDDVKFKTHRPDTLQISTRKKVFILDSKDLVDVLDECEIDRFGELVLFSEKLIKLGYCFDQDSKKLFHSFPKFKHVFTEFSDSIINLNEVVSDMEKRYKLFEERDGNKSAKTRGLSKLTESCFGKALDKSECMSNWQNRPLRKDQMRYASLDAYVLIQIHDFIQKRIKELNIEYDYISRNSYL